MKDACDRGDGSVNQWPQIYKETKERNMLDEYKSKDAEGERENSRKQGRCV